MRVRAATVLLVLAALLAATAARPETAGSGAGASDGKIAPELAAAFADLAPGEQIRAIVRLGPQASLTGLPSLGNRPARLAELIRRLTSTAEAAQARSREIVLAAEQRGDARDFRSFWVFDGYAVTAVPDVLRDLAALPEVERIDADLTLEAPVLPATEAAPEPNLALVGAPDLWALGYRGAGIVVANMDTGVSGSHPDLAARWRGGTNSWYDPNGQHPTTPTDVSGHGTWTMGVMVAGSTGGTAVGVAPEATWIAVKIFDDAGRTTTERIHQGFQWLLDPDGDPATPDTPHVVSNSWTFQSPGCNLTFQPDLQAFRAAGILPVFAAGNAGPNGSTSLSPANNPEAFAVGATDNADVVYGESSRGPSSCADADPTFPELVAPGVGIRTTDLFDGYASETGTSVAAPHVAGALALLLQAHPGISAEEQEWALESSAVDLGDSGPDPDYGYGRLDIPAAHELLATRPDFTLSAAPASATVSPGESTAYTVTIAPRNGFDADVALSLSGSTPPGSSWSFVPPTVTGGSGSSELTVTTSAATPGGTYALTIKGTGGGLTRTARVTLVVESVSTTAFPTSATVQTGTLAGGGPASLAADDSLYYEVASSGKTSAWVGSFAGVPNAVTSLKLTYKGKNSRSCRQTVAIRRWTNGSWVTLDSRDVGPTEILIADLAPGGALADYVGGTSGNGDVAVRVRCKAGSGSFVASGNLLRLDYVG